MSTNLNGKRVAILVADGFEQVEMTEPRKALEAAGATTRIISPNRDTVKGWNHAGWGEEFRVDTPVDRADPADYDALLLPGGVMNPDTLRMNPKAVQFAADFIEAGKPVGAICHGPWLLVEADVVEDRRMTGYPSIRTDLINAGAEWVDEAVVTDQGVVTGRGPADIPAFCRKLVEEVAEGLHARHAG